MDKFCIAPFVHSCTNVGGRNKPCCRFSDSEYFDHKPPMEYFLSPQMDKLRQQMLDNEELQGCAKCYRDEELGHPSLREKLNAEFGVTPHKKLKYIEIGLSNLCNMACVTCDAQYSTTWWKDIDEVNSIPEIVSTKSMKAKGKNKIEYTDFDFNDLSHVTKIKLLGGEPFMEQRNLNFLKKFDLKNINLDLSTNGSVLPNAQWLEVLDSVKNLYLNISIDGKGRVAEFVRHGTNWQKIKNNIKWWQNWRWSKGNRDTCPVYLQIHYVVHALNILDLADYEEWHRSFIGEKMPTYDVCSYPEYLDIKFLPKRIKEHLLKQELPEVVKKYVEKHIDAEDSFKTKQLVKYVEKLTDLRGPTNSKIINWLMWELKK